MNLSAIALACIAAYSANISEGYGVTNPSNQFAVTGPMETRLRDAMLDSVEFLKLIYVADVDQIKGQVVNVGNYDIATGRKSGGRFTTTQGVDGNTYELRETDSCAAVPWATLATWANAGSQGEFMRRMSQNATKRFALDILRVGFNGTSAATNTDPVANPLGQDVNIGWHKIVKDRSPEQIVTDAIYFNPDLPTDTVPKAGEYRTLDAIVMELKALLHPSVRDDPSLRVLIGSDLVAAAQSRLMNQANKPSEQIAAQMLEKTIGGVPAIIPPFFPGKRIVLTIPTNLHCYTQKGTRSRKSENIEDRKQYEDKYWRYEGYAVEYDEAYAAVDEANMTIGAAPAA